MATFTELIKNAKQKDIDFFFGKGNTKEVSNKYFQYRHAIDNDNIIINTNNIKMIKGSPTLVVGRCSAVFLKDWQVRKAHNFDNGMNFDIVKLNRKFFKTYTFKSEFEDFAFDDGVVQTFDELSEIAKKQDEDNMKVALGVMQ